MGERDALCAGISDRWSDAELYRLFGMGFVLTADQAARLHRWLMRQAAQDASHLAAGGSLIGPPEPGRRRSPKTYHKAHRRPLPKHLRRMKKQAGACRSRERVAA